MVQFRSNADLVGLHLLSNSARGCTGAGLRLAQHWHSYSCSQMPQLRTSANSMSAIQPRGTRLVPIRVPQLFCLHFHRYPPSCLRHITTCHRPSHLPTPSTLAFPRRLLVSSRRIGGRIGARCDSWDTSHPLKSVGPDEYEVRSQEWAFVAVMEYRNSMRPRTRPVMDETT